MQQESAHIGFEVVHDLLGQIVGDQLVAPGESVDERVDIAEALKRDRRELQARTPTVGPCRPAPQSERW